MSRVGPVPGGARPGREGPAGTSGEAPPEVPNDRPPVRLPGPGAGPGPGLRAAGRAAAPGWVVARAVTVGALLLARFEVSHLHITDPAARSQSHAGLFGWDAGFYRGIAAHGYRFGAVPHEALRFFPLVPLAARTAGWALGGRPGLALLLGVNACALATAALLYRLVVEQLGDDALATRSAWLLSVAPPAYVLVMGYAEAPFLLFVVAFFWALGGGRPGWAAATGLLAALSRPLGVLLVVPAVVTLVEGGPAAALAGLRAGAGRRWALVGVAAAPLVGCGIYLSWVQAAYGDWHLPFSVQQEGRLRGGVVDPVRSVAHETRVFLQGGHVGSGLHVVWAVVLVGLLAVAARRLPRSWTAFAAVTLLAALSSRNLDSLERYALSCFPFVVAAASLCRRPVVERAALVLSGAALGAYALLAFVGALVP